MNSDIEQDSLNTERLANLVRLSNLTLIYVDDSLAKQWISSTRLLIVIKKPIGKPQTSLNYSRKNIRLPSVLRDIIPEVRQLVRRLWAARPTETRPMFFNP